MTVGIGIVPSQESGVVLVADTFVQAPGRAPFTRSKLMGWHNPPALLIVAGVLGDLGVGLGYGTDALHEAFHGQSLPDALTRSLMPGVFTQIRAAHSHFATMLADGGLRETQGPAVLVASRPRDTPPQLARIDEDGYSWAQPGQAYVIGCVTGGPPDLLKEFDTPAAATLIDCKNWAIDWTWRLMDRVWGKRDPFQLVQEGESPCIGFPLECLTLTDNNITLEVFP